MENVLLYLIVINIFAAIMSCYDKNQARNRSKRINENSFMLIALIGGAFTMYIMMKTIRHKTRKKKFMIGLPVIIFLHLALVVLYFYLLK